MYERKILRMLCGPVVEQGIWRLRTAQELQKMCRDLYIVRDIKKERFEWIGHTVRMNHRRVVKKIFERKLKGRRRMGIPRLT
jgi:hypothetical protein